ncbi:plasmid mobilization relaxosome protein MobC (plasmid) [Desemzia incerta]|uniref:plasmid mobilization protein n=1 Tax=Desemzia incerta TaxID=82801 RepID=UPI0024C28267|nr:plasmid mobilization relaxosome protein MobC [Desemzia incerta]WHZ33247.1 plasmid mobilization relaxosome protein MobC [Desemzia incerta]
MSETRKENRQIKFRVSEQEFKQLEAAAASVGMTVPAFAKSKVKGKRLKSPRIEREGALEIARQLRYYNSNLNQMVRWVNTNKKLYRFDELKGMEHQLEGIRKGLDELWEQLSR